MESFDLGIAVQKIYDFIWEEFCDWYIEMVKPRLYNEADETKAAALYTLKAVLINALKLLHPYMPFITEEIYCTLMEDEDASIMVSDWPTGEGDGLMPGTADGIMSGTEGGLTSGAADGFMLGSTDEFDADLDAVERIKEAVKGIRNVRGEMNVPPSKKAKVIVVTADASVRETFEKNRVFFATLGFASEVVIQEDKTGIEQDAVSVVIDKGTIYMPFAELVDVAKEIERLRKEEKRLAGELKRSEGMLGNPNFVNKAPASKIEEEKAKLEKYEGMMAQVKERLSQLA